MKAAIIVAVILIALAFIFGGYVYPDLPERIATHWNAAGEADGYMSKLNGVFAIPLIMIVLFVLFLVLPLIDPRKENIEKFKGSYNWLIAVMMAFLLYVHVLSLAWNTGVDLNFGIALVPAFAILYGFIGFLLEKTRPNWFVGIRTPWTLSNETVWKKTHHLGAKFFKASGLITLIGLIFPNHVFWFVLTPVIISAVYLIVYSYAIYRKEKKLSSKRS